MRKSQEVSSASLAKSRKRRNSQPRACGCHYDCDGDSANSVRHCKRQDKVKGKVDYGKGLRSGNRVQDCKGKAKEEEEEEEAEEEHENSGGRRRSLRIRDSLKYRGISDVNKECDSQRERDRSRGRDRDGAGCDKRVRFVLKQEKQAAEAQKKAKQSEEKNRNAGNHIESWNTRLRHRLRSLNLDCSVHHTIQVKHEEDKEEKEEREKIIESDGRRCGRKRKKGSLDDCSDSGEDKPYDSEAETYQLVSWARKSKRRRRSQTTLDADSENNHLDINLEQPIVNDIGEEDNVDANQSSDSEDSDEGSSASEGKDHYGKLESNGQSAIHATQDDCIDHCNDPKGQLEVMLISNAIHDQHNAKDSPVRLGKDLGSQLDGNEISQMDGQHGDCIEGKVSDSDNSSRDLGGESNCWNSKAFSRDLDHETKSADSKNASRDLGGKTMHQKNVAGFHIICRSSNKTSADVGKMQKREVGAYAEQIKMDNENGHAKDFRDSTAGHYENLQTRVWESVAHSNKKLCKFAQNEACHEMSETGESDLRESLKVNNNESIRKDYNATSLNIDKPAIIEGRKCGLCGVGNDGRPPKKLSQESIDSDNEICGQLQAATEEPKYPEGDDFGDDSGWLGRLLGPLNDRHGIAGVWVHKLCAVWSPEVYFSGIGCLKNVRAALARGRSLKCSRCGRPGATIGCRVDRCPHTYHLACGRAEGCVFDHMKYLMACTDHLHLFRPRIQSRREMQKIQLRKKVMESIKVSAAALRKDLDAEDKWLENCGEDEEFLRRERKRLQRDLARIAPIYVGGESSDSDKFSNGWESVAGLQNVIMSMKEVVILPLLYPEYFESRSITPPRGVLLHGYPGTGKTLVVRALVGACARGDRRIAYFFRKGADCLGKYVGDAERQLRLLFQVAEQCQPSVIFFDEIDGLAPKRSRQQDQTHSSVVSTLLALMDGLRSRGSVIVIGATNCPEHLDPALRRPGRFDREIYFPLPSVKEREAILDLHTRKWPEPTSGDVLSRVAQQTPGYAGADLQALCTQAALIALKRNFSLQDLFNSGEKMLEISQKPSLPLVTVIEGDWVAALAQAPPPCSRRASSMAINDISALPLQKHMVSALLLPLLELLVSFSSDGRIVLPPPLCKAIILIERIVTSNLEQKSPLTVPWWVSLKSLSLGSRLAKDIEKILSSIGLICDRIESLSSDTLLGAPVEEFTQIFEISSLKNDETHLKDVEKLKLLGNKRRGIGFRVLIAGDPKSGQKYLASCILHGFEGHVEIRKLDLSTMFQEGHGDIIQGLTHILGTCRNIGSCVIFMPKIEVWAVEKKDSEMEEYATSQTWTLLIQQVKSIPADVPLVFLATCEQPGHTLPLQIRNFFISEAAHVSPVAHNKYTPCFCVQLPTSFDCNFLIDQSAKNITRIAITRYIQNIHDISHFENLLMRKYEAVSSHGCMGERSRRSVIDSSSKADIEGKNSLVSKPNDLHKGHSVDGFYKGTKNNSSGARDGISLSDAEGHNFGMKDNWQEQWPNHFLNSNSYQGSGKVRTTLQLAITACGYQLLWCPQFAELCWVTSKLKEGPCTTPDGPWKGWPFNSCTLDTSKSEAETQSGDSCGEQKDKACSSVVRGLIAVGLLAYKGFYNTGKEVASDVRKVLDLLVGKIKTKIQNGKDKYQFLPLLTQAASLEDMMNSWAYDIQSLEDSSSTSVALPTASTKGRPESTLHMVNANSLFDGQRVNLQADMCTVPDLNSKKVQPCDSSSPNLSLPGSSVAAVSNICMQKNHVDSNKAAGKHDIEKEKLEKPSIFSMPVNGIILKNSPNQQLHDPENVGLQCPTGFRDIHVDSIDSTDKIDNSGSFPSSKMQCVYKCCFECIHTVHAMVKQFLKNCWKAEGSSSRLENVQDLIASCTVDILAVVSQFCIKSKTDVSGSRKRLAALFDQISCSCQYTRDNQLMPASSTEERNTKTEEVIVRDCKCHASPRKKNARRKHSLDTSWLEANLEFVVVGHMCNSNLKPANCTPDIHYHCKTKQFCLCSLIQKVSNIRKTLH